MRRRVVLGGALTLVVAAAALAVVRSIGMDLGHAIALAAALLATGALVLVRTPTTTPIDALPDSEPRPGGRRDLDELAWAMLERRTHVRKIVLDRVREVARGRLAGRGLDPQRVADGPAITALLGPVAWSVLTPERTRPVLPSALETTLQALRDVDAPPALPPSSNRSTRAD